MQTRSNHWAELCEDCLAAANAAPAARQRIAFLKAALWFATAAYRAALGGAGPMPNVEPSRLRHESRPDRR